MTIGVYNTHEEALEAVKALRKSDFPLKQLSVVGQAELVDDHLHMKQKGKLNVLGVSVGAALGPVIGVLTGVGLFAIPGLGFLYGAGAIVGAIAGFDFGLIGGSAVSIFSSLGLKKEKALKYEEHLKAGQFLVIAQGSAEEVNQAQEILKSHGTHHDLEVHS